MLTRPRSQTRALHSPSLVALVGCLRQRATDENPPCSSCVFYLQVLQAPVHRKHPPSLDRTAAPGLLSHKHADAVRGAHALSTRQEMRSLKLHKYINLESLKANKHHLERLFASRAPESNQIQCFRSLSAFVSAIHPSSPTRSGEVFCDVSPCICVACAVVCLSAPLLICPSHWRLNRS